MMGVFVSLDFFLFYVFWEVSLVPMYFLIGIWGGRRARKRYAAIKFFLYTLVGSVVMLLAILAIYFSMRRAPARTPLTSLELTQCGRPAGTRSLPTVVGAALAFWAFFIGFAIKVPLFPFHTWLPDAHVEAPTAGSVILAGVLLKLGGYGMIRILLPIFPDAVPEVRPIIAILAADQHRLRRAGAPWPRRTSRS